jgi:hypothetical protein
VDRRIEVVLIKGVLTSKGPVVVITLECVSGRVEVLVKSVLASERAIAVIILECEGRGVEVLLESKLALEGVITIVTPNYMGLGVRHGICVARLCLSYQQHMISLT